MISRTTLCAAALISSLLLLVAGADHPQADEATQKLYDKYRAEYSGLNDHWQADAKLVTDLATAPDADWCFLEDYQSPTNDRRGTVDFDQLGKLNTQRTFDAVVAGLKSEKLRERNIAIGTLSAFNRKECVPLLLEILNADPEESVRANAAAALERYADPKSEPALLKAARGDSRAITLAAVRSLAPLKSKEGLAIAIGVMEKAQKQELENSAEIVASYHTKTAVAALLTQFKRVLSDDAEGWNTRLRNDIHVQLFRCIGAAAKDMAPFPDERLDEWQDWWARAEPLLTDNLELKSPPLPARKWRGEEFANTAQATSFAAEVDAKTFRLGDPIRLELALSNTGKSPISTILPQLPSGWWSTMAYGIKLERGPTVLLDLAPSAEYIGSYSGPPAFQTLAPGESYRSSICLQHWCGHLLSTPLPEGDYQLEITFDSAEFAFIKPAGNQLVHRWSAPPIKFTIQGEALKDPKEILSLIAEKTHQKFLVEDLASPQSMQRISLGRAIFNYGDSRLTPFVKKFESEHPDHAYYYLNATNLRPFEHEPHTPALQK